MHVHVRIASTRRALVAGLAAIAASLAGSAASHAEGRSNLTPAVSAQRGASPEGPAADPTAGLPDETVLARVNGAPITIGDVRIAMKDMADRLPRLNDASRQDHVLSYLIDLHLGSRAAIAQQLDLTPEFERKAAYNRNKLLLDELLASEARKAVTPEAAQKTYQQTLKDVRPEEEVRARHILTATEEDAAKALARLKAGEDFAVVAGAMSTDPTAARNGGELGWFSRDRMAPEFSEAAFRLKAGELSSPVKTQFGWHVIQLEERRTRAAASFDEVRPEIEAYLTRKAQQDLVLGLRSKAKIERVPLPAPPAPAPASPEPQAPTSGAVKDAGATPAPGSGSGAKQEVGQAGGQADGKEQKPEPNRSEPKSPGKATPPRAAGQTPPQDNRR